METVYVDRMVHDGENWVWKTFPEQLDTESDFRIIENNIQAEAIKSSQLMVRYGTLSAELEVNLKREEENAKYVAARVASAIRATAEQNGKKMTEGKVEEELLQNEEYRATLNKLNLVRADALKADHWWRAILKRVDLVIALCHRQNAEIRRADY